MRETLTKNYSISYKSSPFLVETQPCQPQVTGKKKVYRCKWLMLLPLPSPDRITQRKIVISSTNMVIWLVVDLPL